MHRIEVAVMSKALPCLLLILVPWAASGLAQQPLTRLEGCIRVPTEWADGDSFLVRAADGKEFTLRLYGADCLEWHVNDETDARRLRAQRRYFGISRLGGSPQDSIELAKGFGKAAAERVAVLTAEAVTVHTAWADARGDGRFERVYGFVQLADGRDLAAVLVEEGLARAFGVYRETSEGETNDEYREAMADRELQAAKLGRGIWGQTDWEALPAERREQRKEEAELEQSEDPRELLIGGLKLDPNTAARDELLRLPGVGEVLANRIIEGRPYVSVDDLDRVPGIGGKTLERLKPFLAISNAPR